MWTDSASARRSAWRVREHVLPALPLGAFSFYEYLNHFLAAPTAGSGERTYGPCSCRILSHAFRIRCVNDRREVEVHFAAALTPGLEGKAGRKPYAIHRRSRRLRAQPFAVFRRFLLDNFFRGPTLGCWKEGVFAEGDDDH